MTYKNKLIDLLKWDSQVKEQMEKLEFWCNISRWNNKDAIWWFIWDWFFFLEEWEVYFGKQSTTHIPLERIFIIWLPLQERFIRMYCSNKMYGCEFDSNHIISIYREFLLYDGTWDGFDKKIMYNSFADFDNQEDKVYQQIYEALIFD